MNLTSAVDRPSDTLYDDLRGETFERQEGRLVHRIVTEAGEVHATMEDVAPEEDPKSAWWRGYLAGIVPEPLVPKKGRLRTVDLFCGPGGLAQGVGQLAREMGVRVVAEAIVDRDVEATRVYAANHDTRSRRTESATAFLDHAVRGRGAGARFAYAPEVVDEAMAALVGRVDVVLAGPPCQGHSNLNNQTRRDDVRNGLYLVVPAMAVALDAPVVVIENVPAVVRDVNQVTQTARVLLEAHGYVVEEGVLAADRMGWPQTRKRHFMVARRDRAPLAIGAVARVLEDANVRSVEWAIGALAQHRSAHPLDQRTALSEENQRRIEWLFEADAHDLALPERPPSHREGTSYGAVYGRMRRDAPAPTITTGFMTPGRGRFVHPTEPRVLTAREAARLQGFPDTYRFVVDGANPPGRSDLAKWIGDAVPMPLGYAAMLAALWRGLPER